MSQRLSYILKQWPSEAKPGLNKLRPLKSHTLRAWWHLYGPSYSGGKKNLSV